MKTFALAAAVSAAALFASSAQAAIFIGLASPGVDGDNGGAACVSGGVCTVASGATTATFSGTYGSFIELITGADAIDPSLLFTSTNDHSTLTTGGDLDIYVTRQGITGPIPTNFFSSYTQNGSGLNTTLPSGWVVTQSTLVDAGNGLYSGVELSSVDFDELDTFFESAAFGGGAGPYSVTTKISIRANSEGSTGSTINVAGVVPEPATWGLMIMGFGGAGAMLRRRQARMLTA